MIEGFMTAGRTVRTAAVGPRPGAPAPPAEAPEGER